MFSVYIPETLGRFFLCRREKQYVKYSLNVMDCSLENLCCICLGFTFITKAAIQKTLHT